MKNNDIVILLTATIKPGRMIMTKLKNEEIRIQQYLNAIEYYLVNTKFNIVFCENTNTNIFSKINSEYKESRLEYLSFSGNDYDFSYGKSYGERKIIEYALENSKFLGKAKYILKITGRLKILNINRLINSTINNRTVYCEFLFKEFICAVCYILPKDSLKKFINMEISSFNENIGNHIETALYKYLLSDKSLNIKEFHPIIDGISGSFNVKYNELYEYSNEITIRKLNHYAIASNFHKKKKALDSYVWSKMQWLLYLIIYKIKFSIFDFK